jgi:hypothetical protein
MALLAILSLAAAWVRVEILAAYLYVYLAAHVRY